MVSSRHPHRASSVQTLDHFTCKRSSNFQPLTNCLKSDTHSEPLYFQQVPTVKFSKSCALITIRIARGWVYPSPCADLKSYFNSLPSTPASAERACEDSAPCLLRSTANDERSTSSPLPFSQRATVSLPHFLFSLFRFPSPLTSLECAVPRFGLLSPLECAVA